MIAQLLMRLAEEYPDKIAFSFKGRDESSQTVTYRELHRDALCIAASIIQNNPDRKVVYVAMRQSIGFIKVLFGCIYSGMTFLPTYPIRNIHDIARLKEIIKTVDPAFIIVDDVAPLDELNKHLNCEIVPALNLSTDETLSSPKPTADCVFFQCSSGTTRNPKAIQVTKKSLIAGLANMKQYFNLTPSDIGCSWLPPYHDMGLIGCIFLPVYVGFTTHLMSPSAFMMNPLSWLEYISLVRATISVAPSIAFDLCARRAKAKHDCLDLSSLRILVNSAQMIQPRVTEKFVATFASMGLNPDAMLNAYGLAEATLMVTCTQSSQAMEQYGFQRLALRKGIVSPLTYDADPIYVANCGKPICGMSIKIVDRFTGNLMPANSVGEIWVSGNSLTGGYYLDVESTSTIFNRKINGLDESYIATGDTGFVSADGCLFITGRIKDSIKTGHGLVSAEEIEEIIESHDYLDPSYRCAALMITRHDESEIVVLREIDREVDPVAHGSQMLYLLRKHYMLGVNKIIYMRRGKIPTTTSGKIKRHAATVLYTHDLLDPLYEYSFDPGLDSLDLKAIKP